MLAWTWRYITDMTQRVSTLICPHYGHASEEEMPTDACVFCSYGIVPCPPIQDGKGCCS